MFDNFQSAWIFLVLIDRSNNEATEGATFSAKVCSIHAVIPSGPAEELFLMFFLKECTPLQRHSQTHQVWNGMWKGMLSGRILEQTSDKTRCKEIVQHCCFVRVV